MYDIRFRAGLNLLDIRWSGSFTPEAVGEYAGALRGEFVRSGFCSGYLLRMDMRGSAVQPRQAVAAFSRHFANFPKAERIAVLTGSAIAQAQVSRVMRQPYLRIFDGEERASEWLFTAPRSGGVPRS